MLVKRPGPGDLIAAGGTRQLGPLDDRKIIRLDTATGSVVVLPPALGRRRKFEFVVTVLATSNSHIIKVQNSTDVMRGIMMGFRADLGNAVLGFAAGTNDDTITLNRTTTGSVSLGEWIEAEDIAAGIWAVRGLLSSTGAAFATPFSSTV